MNRGVFLILVIFLVSVTIVSSGEDKVDDAVEEKLLEQEKVKVIVILKDEPVKKLFRRSVSAEKIDVKIKVLEKLDKKDFEKKRDFGSFSGFSGEVTKEGLEKLKNDPNVEKIIIDKPIRAFLSESVPLINANVVHNYQLDGINLTGDGQTICLVDSGVNSSHEDLVGKVIAEKCYCQVGGVNCCPEGGNEETGEGLALDDYGHGTQMAGIISADGNLKGVAPDAKIAAVKVINSGGNGIESDLIKGIEWCVDNKDAYNITIISLSLGGLDNYDSYCDSEESVSAVINNAVAVDISVFAASGNDGNYTAISSPACIENTTSVGAVYDASIGPPINWSDVPCIDSSAPDKITCFTNRNSILDLLAPGALIISTSMNGGSSSARGGTSQATPHVAGAVALLKQYADLELNRILNKSEIQNVLNNSGIGIYDSESGNTYARIDVYEAVKDLDDKSPRITISLSNDTLEYNQQNLTINISYEDVFLDSYNANISYPNGSLLSEIVNNLELTTENLTELGNYKITAWANDTNGNENITSETFLVSDITGLPNFTFNYPDDGNITGNNLVYFNINISSKYNLTNVSLYHNSTNWGINETLSLNNNETTIEFNSSFSDGRYLWGIEACDVNNYCVFSENRSFIMDETNPVVRLYSPGNASTVTSLPIVFTFNVSDYEIKNCFLTFNETINETLNNVNLESNNVFIEDIYYLPNGNYNWSVNCTDKVGRTGVSNTWELNLECSSSWTRSCGDWSECSGGSKTKICYDANYCSSEAHNQSSTSGCDDDDDSGDSDDDSSEGGDATTQSTTESVLGFSGTKGSTKAFSISKDVGITGISIELNNDVTDARLTVKKLSEKPSSVTALSNVNRYVEIETLNLVENDIKEAIIKFKVEKTWINANADSVNHVFMHRYKDGKWEKLDTLTAGVDDEYQKYQATTPGFSYFAVNAEKTSSLVTASVVKNLENETISGNETNVSKGFSFADLFSGSAVKNLTGKGIYNIIYVIIGLLVLGVLTYKRKIIITKFKEIKKPKFIGVKNKFKSMGDYLRKRKEKFNGARNVRKIKREENKIFKQQLKRAKLKSKEKDKIAKEEARAVKLEVKKELKLQKKTEEKERYEVKDRGKENWEDFDVDWEE